MDAILDSEGGAENLGMRAARPKKPTRSNDGAEKENPVTTGRRISIRLRQALGFCLFFDFLHGGYKWGVLLCAGCIQRKSTIEVGIEVNKQSP